MKRFKPIGLLLLAIFALGAFAASTASAEEGFLEAGGGKPAKGTLLGGASTLAIEGGAAEIKCTTLDDSTFTFSNDKHATGTIHWLGCKAAGVFPFDSLGDSSEIILVPAELLVCLDAKNSAGTLLANFGIAVEVKAVHLEIPATGSLIEVNGRALGTIEGAKGTLFGSKFEGAKGTQTVTKCLEGANEKTHNLTGAENHGTPKPASENVVAGLLQFPKEVELMDS
jgi:hypothetical protein